MLQQNPYDDEVLATGRKILTQFSYSENIDAFYVHFITRPDGKPTGTCRNIW